jgi:hypothetical protein
MLLVTVRVVESKFTIESKLSCVSQLNVQEESMSMKTKLLCLFILAMFLTLTVAQAAELEGVKIGVGSLRMGGIFQSWLYATNWDNTLQYGGVDKYTEFTVKRARFLFWGTIVPDKVKYFAQLDMVNAPAFLDYKMIFANYVPKTSISVGRFLPYWTLYMWKPVSELELIHYPLIEEVPSEVLSDVPNFAMWRQGGVQSATDFDMFSVYLGLFNGADYVNNNGDNNNAKDFMARLDIHPAMENINLLFGGEFWLGRYKVSTNADSTEGTTMFGGFLSLDYNKMLKFRGEYMMRTTKYGWYNPDIEKLDDLKSAGFYVTGGYMPIDWLEVLARYDYFDPNTLNKEDVQFMDHPTNKDAESWFTLGVNYMFHKYNAVIALNLIKKTEQWKIADPLPGDPEHEIDLDNDEAILQFQIAF